MSKTIKYLGINLTKEVERHMLQKNLRKKPKTKENGKIFYANGLEGLILPK